MRWNFYAKRGWNLNLRGRIKRPKKKKKTREEKKRRETMLGLGDRSPLSQNTSPCHGHLSLRFFTRTLLSSLHLSPILPQLATPLSLFLPTHTLPRPNPSNPQYLSLPWLMLDTRLRKVKKGAGRWRIEERKEKDKEGKEDAEGDDPTDDLMFST